MAEKISDLSWRKKIVFYLAVWFGWILILLLCSTLKIKCEGLEHMQEFRRKKQPSLLAIWHGRIFVHIFLFRFWHFVVLVSQHWDGEMIARTLHRLGFSTVRGSSTRGGKQAFHQMVRLLHDGKTGVIIPDGPKGPKFKLKPGLIYMAHQANVPIIFLTFSASSAIVFKSWDRFMLPKPFARVIVKISAPIWLNKEGSDQDFEQQKQRIEEFMIKQEKAADAFFAK